MHFFPAYDISLSTTPKTIMSDHGTNFMGTDRELKNLTEFLQERKTQETVSNFCPSHSMEIHSSTGTSLQRNLGGCSQESKNNFEESYWRCSTEFRITDHYTNSS